MQKYTKILNYFTVEEYEKVCDAELNALTTVYKFYYSGDCYKIENPIEKVINKPEHYNHRVTLYYDNESIYLVCYLKNQRTVHILTVDGMIVNRYVHKLARQLSKYAYKPEC